jgi:hypothetical protein
MISVDPNKLTSSVEGAVTDFVTDLPSRAQHMVTDKVQDTLGTLTSFSKTAEGFGINGIGDLMKWLTDWIQTTFASLGISFPKPADTTPSVQTTPAPAASNTPPNPAAKAAAQVAAANANASKGTNVASASGPAPTPTASKSPRAVG